MANSALTVFLVSIFVFVVILTVVRKERQLNRRFFASTIRSWLDNKVDSLGSWLLLSWDHFVKYIVQLHWYYSIHSVLQAVLRVIVAIYTYFEKAFERNRVRTKELRAEKRQFSELNHLHHMAVHKKDTALSPAEQRKLRKKKLEERS